MDEAVIKALARWPNVPAVYGWLSLDRRGQWRLQGEPVRHAGLVAFISRNYAAMQAGEWFFQNGPQRVYADLAYTPWVLRWSPHGGFVRHTGEAVTHPSGAWVDEHGNLLIAFEAGVGLVHDQDLAGMSGRFSATPQPGDGEQAIAAFLDDPAGAPLCLNLDAVSLPVRSMLSADMPARFGFKQRPEPHP